MLDHIRRRKVEKSCVTFLLCDPGCYVHKPDVQNKWDDNTMYNTTTKQSKVFDLGSNFRTIGSERDDRLPKVTLPLYSRSPSS